MTLSTHEALSKRQRFIVYESLLQKTDARDKFSKLVQMTCKLLMWSGRVAGANAEVAKRIIAELAICRTLIRLGKCFYAFAPTLKKWGTWSPRQLQILMTHHVSGIFADGIPDLTWMLKVSGLWSNVGASVRLRMLKTSQVGALIGHVVSFYLSLNVLSASDGALRSAAAAAARRRDAINDAVVAEAETKQLVGRIAFVKVACDLIGATNSTFELGMPSHIAWMFGWTGAASACVKHWLKARESSFPAETRRALAGQNERKRA